MSILLDEIIQLKKEGKQTIEVMKLTNASRTHVKRAWQNYKSGKYQLGTRNEGKNKKGISLEVTKNKAIWTYIGDKRIETLEEALNFCKVDLKEWFVDRHNFNTWTTSYKDLQGKAHQKLNTQIKIWFKRKEEEFVIEQSIEKTINEMKKYKPIRYLSIKKKEQKNSHLALVSFVDSHVGKLAIEEESGENYNVKIAIDIRNWAVDEAINDIQKRNIHKILYIIGNDDTHIDNKNGTTTRGTHVDYIGKWWQHFEAVKHSHIRTIDNLRLIAPVEVKSMQGNHDGHLAYFMGATLNAWYNKCENVNIDYKPTPQKYFIDGITLFMITHGRHEKRKNLPLIMSTDVPDLWGKAKCREIITGDLHHKKDINYIGTEDIQSITVRILPTLSGLDLWHKERGYRSLRSADIFYYDKKYGLDGTKHIPLLAKK